MSHQKFPLSNKNNWILPVILPFQRKLRLIARVLRLVNLLSKKHTLERGLRSGDRNKNNVDLLNDYNQFAACYFWVYVQVVASNR